MTYFPREISRQDNAFPGLIWTQNFLNDVISIANRIFMLLIESNKSPV